MSVAGDGGENEGRERGKALALMWIICYYALITEGQRYPMVPSAGSLHGNAHGTRPTRESRVSFAFH